MNYINFEQIYQHFDSNQFYFDEIDFNVKTYTMKSIEFKKQENIVVECSICLEEFIDGEILMHVIECKVFYINK